MVHTVINLLDLGIWMILRQCEAYQTIFAPIISNEKTHNYLETCHKHARVYMEYWTQGSDFILASLLSYNHLQVYWGVLPFEVNVPACIDISSLCIKGPCNNTAYQNVQKHTAVVQRNLITKEPEHTLILDQVFLVIIHMPE
ncbi:hypothetical protein ACJX0J_029859 [Zea mays]